MPRLEFEARFSLPINGIEYTVGIASREAFDGFSTDGRTVEGVTDTQKALIVIAEDTPDGRRPAVFWHEFIHAALGESGSQLYAVIVGCSDEDAAESEERLCRYLGPVLASTLAGPQAILDLLSGDIGSRDIGSRKAKRGRALAPKPKRRSKSPPR